MKVIVTGDFCENARVSQEIANQNFADLFDSIRPILHEADYSITNFEFPITTNDGVPIAKCGPNLKGSGLSVSAIKYAGVNVCTLANNHILDQGEKCCLDTRRLLEDDGIKTVGVGDNLKEAGNILYLEKENSILAVINCCEHEFTIATDSTAGANPLNPIQQYYKIQEARKNANYVLVIVHGGHEHYQLPSPRMKELFHFFVDAGADAVINHHQHCYSGHELYNQKPIVYGLGNFCFDWDRKRNSEWNLGYLANLEFGVDVSLNVIPYTQCNEKPKVETLNGKQLDDFYQKLKSINNIIANDTLLLEEYEKFSRSKKWDMNSLVMPYSNRYLIALCNRGFLPKFFSRTKKLLLYNFINCESHRDLFLKYLSKYDE